MYSYKFGCLILGCIFIVSCSSGAYQDLSDYITQLKKQEEAKQKKPTTLNVKIPKVATYQATTLRSPFGATELAAANAQIAAVNPLQAYPLNVLRFVGTVATVDGKISAYVMAPDNKIYQVKPGDLIGDHAGVVETITTTEIKITEQEIEYGKPPQKNEIVLQLKDVL